MALATFMVRPWRREPGQSTVFDAGCSGCGLVCGSSGVVWASAAVGRAKAKSKFRIREGELRMADEARDGILPSQAERRGAFWEAVFMVERVCGFGVFVVVVMVFVWIFVVFPLRFNSFLLRFRIVIK